MHPLSRTSFVHMHGQLVGLVHLSGAFFHWYFVVWFVGIVENAFAIDGNRFKMCVCLRCLALFSAPGTSFLFVIIVKV
jgi:hypothetical protein